MSKTSVSETKTENLFRSFYGAETFIEKSAIPSEYGFVSKKGTGAKGYPDFFLDNGDIVFVIEAKAKDHDAAEEETQLYMSNNKIDNDIIGIAVSGQSKSKIRLSYYYKRGGTEEIVPLKLSKTKFIPLEEIIRGYEKEIAGESITDEMLTNILSQLNNKFHRYQVRDTERSLFFSAIMIALSNNNFANIYKSIQAPTEQERATTQTKLLEAHHLNDAILNAVSSELSSKVNNLSKEFNWRDRFSFIKTIDIPIIEYIAIIKMIEEKIFLPFKNDEKQDILGRAYKIFLKRAGQIDNKNIILTPDHIKTLMVQLARLNANDVVLDTCTGSGGFLMEAMETMLSLADNEKQKQYIREEQLIGFEIDYVLFSLACSNMFLHGDGRTNMLYRSSLVDGDNPQDKVLYDYIKGLKPTKVIINPPYENNNPFLFTESAIDYLEPNGKLVIIIPSSTFTKTKETEVKRLLKKAKLDFVIKLPKAIFKEQGRDVATSIFGFTKTPHNVDDEVLFYKLEDDGFESVQHKGRVDVNNTWDDKQQEIIDAVRHLKEIEGVSSTRKIFHNNDLVMYGMKSHSSEKYDIVKLGDILDTSVRGALASKKNTPNGNIDFITAAEEWKKHDTAQMEDTEAIIYAVSAEGSLGRAHYVNGTFMASNLCLVLRPKDEEKYPVDLEFYSYYLTSIKSQLVEDLKDGTSKQTIAPDRLASYLIEYIPYEEQLALKQNIRNHMDEYEQMKKALAQKQLEIDTLFKDLSDF